jgi:hypothetical protein
MGLGYQDTPLIPGTDWHVHDGERPQPRVVTPTNLGEIAPVSPPSDAVVLFDGSDLEQWESEKDGSPAKWEIVGDAMRVVPGTGGIRTKARFGDIQLHVEWAAPAEVKGESQGRGNSGVFLMGRYEVQVLDCYQNPTYADGATGALYGQYPPLVNACVPPGQWNVYDIIWEAPAFEGDEVKVPAYITVLQNGLLLHHRVELMGLTGHRVAPSYTPHQSTGSISLQDHGDLVQFRNIWLRELKGYDA